MSSNIGNIGPELSYLEKDYVLVQAWKKSQQYIRLHNWYADTLELDISTINIRSLLKAWSKIDLHQFKPDKIKLVPAPKANTVKYESNKWQVSESRLRYLAHVSIRDQTYATACMMCLANIVETRQGSTSQISLKGRPLVSVNSYGNRLFCDWKDNNATFRWANSGTYSKYYQDYQAFISRVENQEKRLINEGKHWIEIRMDIKQFYDNVTPEVLHQKTEDLLSDDAIHSREFLNFFKKLTNWEWDDASYELLQGLNKEGNNYKNRIALPQGLVASGFFANIVLLGFDEEIRCLKIENDKWELYDYCRYVDDMRFLLATHSKDSSINVENEIKEVYAQIKKHVVEILSNKAPGLTINELKSDVISSLETQSKLYVSKTMKNVDQQLSGPLDLTSAWDLSALLQGLLEIPQSTTGKDVEVNELIRLIDQKPDVENDSVCRFAAHRIRKVLRLSRILAFDECETEISFGLSPQKKDVDLRIENVAKQMIMKFIDDPVNIRLLIIAFDLYPSVKILKAIHNLLIGSILQNTDGTVRLVSFYCISELFRAAATQIGFVRVKEELPKETDDININKFRNCLTEYANDLLGRKDIPWYTRQQALLFLAVQGKCRLRGDTPFDSYVLLHEILAGRATVKPEQELCEGIALSIVAYQLSNKPHLPFIADILKRAKHDLKPYLFSIVSSECSDVYDLLKSYFVSVQDIELLKFYSFPRYVGLDKAKKVQTLSLLEAANLPNKPFRNELGILKLALALALKNKNHTVPLSPQHIKLTTDWTKINEANQSKIKIDVVHDKAEDIRYEIPPIYEGPERTKRAIGQLLRTAIIGGPDYSQRFTGHSVCTLYKYIGINTCWQKRAYGIFNGRTGLGAPDLPISPWVTEGLIPQLCAWPGETPNNDFDIDCSDTDKIIKVVQKRLQWLENKYNKKSVQTLEFPVTTELVRKKGKPQREKVQIAVVQSVLPTKEDFEKSPKVDLQNLRNKQQRHFLAVLSCVKTMFDARLTHLSDEKMRTDFVDLVVFPELSIHYDDIFYLKQISILYRCMIFGGLIFFDHPFEKGKLVNQGVWIIPCKKNNGTWTSYELFQGKHNLSKYEDNGKIPGLVPYRPCQWIVNLNTGKGLPFKITASICYDATDIRLAADLKNETDCYIISAFNPDIGTFDNIAETLNYLMYQYVIISNNGLYGGSTAQMPVRGFDKTIVHSHGKNQISISFFDILLKQQNKKICSKYKAEPADFQREPILCTGCNECKATPILCKGCNKYKKKYDIE